VADAANARLKYARGDARYKATQILGRLTRVKEWREQFMDDEVKAWRELGIPATKELIKDKYS